MIGNSQEVQNQMKVAGEILEKLETFDPTCILAGGAPRDWYFGNPATDLDFFVYFRPDLQMWHHKNMLRKVGLNVKIKGSEDFPENYKRNPHLMYVYEGKYKGETFQVMFMNEKTFNCVVDLFPFGICQAWWKGENYVSHYDTLTGKYSPSFTTTIHTTREFRDSVNHKVLRIVNDLYNDADGYIEKIRNKFPDYLYIPKG